MPRPAFRRPRTPGGSSWTFDDAVYLMGIAQTGDGWGADTWGGAANGQDYADDGINDEESLVRTETDHDTYGGSPWTLYSGTGAVLNYAGNDSVRGRIRLDNGGQGLPPWRMRGMQLSWPVDQTLEEMWDAWYNYPGSGVDFGTPGGVDLPASFDDSWITGYRVRLAIQGGEAVPWWIQFVSGLPDNAPDYTESDPGVVVHPKVYFSYQGKPWTGSIASTDWAFVDVAFPPGTAGLPVSAWGGNWRMRIGVDEDPSIPVIGDDEQYIIEWDQVRVYVDFTIAV